MSVSSIVAGRVLSALQTRIRGQLVDRAQQGQRPCSLLSGAHFRGGESIHIRQSPSVKDSTVSQPLLSRGNKIPSAENIRGSSEARKTSTSRQLALA